MDKEKLQFAVDIRILDAFVSPLRGSFPDTLLPGPGLSFSHSGLSHQEVMKRLKLTDDKRDESNPAQVVRRLCLEDSENGLQVTLEYTVYPAHQAVVYGGMLRNAGPRNIEHLRDLRSYDLKFSPLQKFGSPRVHTLGGGVAHSFYPPLAYRLQEWHLAGPTQMGIGSGPGGRSSDGDLPFFFIEDGNRSSGVYGGIEWSSLWHIGFTRYDGPEPIHYGQLGPDKSLSVVGGMDEVDMLLQTGETFYIPRVLLGFYQGSIAEGRNVLRRFISDWMPNLADGKWTPFIQATPGGYICPTEMTTQAQCRAHAAANAGIGVEYYIIENWFASLADRPFTMGATGARRGDWQPDAVRFPDLKNLADYIRAQGMKFGLWTDMEVVHTESPVAREHPDWVLYLNGEPDGLLNLGLREAQDWAIAVYDRLVEEYGLEWIFYDNNINPRRFWNAHEPQHRRGRLQHDHVRGVWRIWEETRRRHPDVIFENCSSGGRRIDLGTLARAHCAFTSDQFRDAELIRCQFSGANTVLPGGRIINGICKGNETYMDFTFHANFAGMIAVSEGVENWSSELKRQAKQHMDVYKSIRRFLSEDYYPLFPQPRSLEEWDGWQFHEPVSDEGFVLVFRVRSPQETVSPRLCGLNGRHEYLLTDPYTGHKELIAGNILLGSGLSVTLPLEGTRLLCYRPRDI